MPMHPDELMRRMKVEMPDADIQLESLVADNDHFKMTITSKSFEGLSRIKQHQLVYKALGRDMGTTLHALSIVTKTPKES